MKNSNDTIGNRTRDRLACSAVPQPTAPPRGLNGLATCISWTALNGTGSGQHKTQSHSHVTSNFTFKYSSSPQS
jgi:hypothetical protein